MQQPKLFSSASALLLLASSFAAASDAPVVNEEWAERLVDVDGISQAAVDQGEAIGVETLLIQNDVVLLHRAYGVEDRDRTEPLAPGAIWSVKSMTKPMVALAVLMLVDDGKVALHEPIATWLPGFAGDKRVTVSDLLSHRSGVVGLGGRIRGKKGLRQWVESWAERPPAGPMGQYRYSDFNFAVAALIISERSGMTAEEFITRRILQPLGMTDSYLHFDPSYDWADRVPSRYVKRNGDFQEVWEQEMPIWYPFFPGGWGLWTTAKDYAKFIRFWLDRGSANGRQLIDPALIDLALTPHTRQVDGTWAYGLGWFLHGANADRDRPLTFYHGGYDGTRAYAFPASDTIAILLTHSRGSQLLQQYEGELVAVRDLGAESPRIELADSQSLKPFDAALAAAWAGEYSGTAFVGENDYPVTMKITREAETLRWNAAISMPSGVSERTALFVAESAQLGWLARERDGAPFYIRRNRKLTLSKAGRLVLSDGERVVAEVHRVPAIDP